MLSTMATDAVTTLANLPPLHTIIDNHCHNADIHLATLPTSHPLSKPVTNAAARVVKWHPTPIHDLMYRFSIKPRVIKKIQAARHSTNQKPGVMTTIETDREKAISSVEVDDSDVKIFMDGSGMNGSIGASVAPYRFNRLKASLQFRLGGIEQHMIYEGEATRILLAMQLILGEINIYIDNCALIITILLTKSAPDHYLLDMFHKAMAAIKKKLPGISIYPSSSSGCWHTKVSKVMRKQIP